jgi:hypothetical protein
VDLVRRYRLPVLCGLIAEGILTVILWIGNGSTAPAGLMFLVEAAILGYVFGAEAGAVGSVVPLVVLALVAVPTAGSGDRGADLALLAFAALLLGFIAWFTGKLAVRYGRRR